MPQETRQAEAASIRPLFASLVGFCVPLSYGIKLEWALPIPFMEPTFVAILLYFLFQRSRFRIIRIELLLVFAFVLSATFAARNPEVSERLPDAFAHVLRLGAFICLAAWARGLDPDEAGRFGTALAASLLVQLVVSFAIVAVATGYLPNLLGFDLGYLDYESRFTVTMGGLSIPRLLGTFPEPAPFGMYGVASLIIVLICSRHMAPRARIAGYIAAPMVVLSSLSDQAVLALAVVLFAASFRTLRSRSNLRAVKLVALVAVAVVSLYVADRLMGKWGELGEVESFDTVWGASGAERIVNSLLAWTVFREHWTNMVIGVGPSLFGVFASQMSAVLPDTHQVQVLIPDLLVSVGGVGTAVFLMTVFIWFRRAQGERGRWYLLAILIAMSFQADFKTPAIAAAIGMCLRPSDEPDPGFESIRGSAGRDPLPGEPQSDGGAS